LTLSGVNTYIGTTGIDGGALVVNGSIAISSLTKVNGGTLGDTGTAGNTQVNSGGTFAPGSGAPGSKMTVASNLAFQSGAIYLVQVSPSTTSFANVTGRATLIGGTMQAVLAPGSYVARSYDILHAGGTTFGTAGFAAGLDYHFTRDTVLGFALAGGRTKWDLAQELGGGRSDAFRPAPTPRRAPGQPISRGRLHSPITGCQPIVSRRSATTSAPISTHRVLPDARKPVIVSVRRSLGSRPMPRRRRRASARRDTARLT
jgi:autotransporter-associated beta strand protein